MHDLLPTSCTNLQKNYLYARKKNANFVYMYNLSGNWQCPFEFTKGEKLGSYLSSITSAKTFTKHWKRSWFTQLRIFSCFFESDSQQTRQPAGNYNLVLTSLSLRCFTNSMSGVKSSMAIEQAVRVACNIQSWRSLLIHFQVETDLPWKLLQHDKKSNN